MNETTSASTTRVQRIADPRRFPGAEERAAAPRDHEQIASRRRAAAERFRAGGAPRDEVHRLEHRNRRRHAERRDEAIDGGACRVDDNPRGDLDLAAAVTVDCPYPGDAPAIDEEPRRLDVIRKGCAQLIGGDGEGERQAIGFDEHVVVPDRRARRMPAGGGWEALDRRRSREHATAWQATIGLHAAVAVEGHQAIEGEAEPHRRLAAGERARERKHEGQRTNGVRRDPRDRPALAHRFPRAAHIECLQVPQPAVDRAEMVERRAAAEIVALDERDREPALRRVVRDRQPINAAADDQHVEGAGREPIEIARHCRNPSSFQRAHEVEASEPAKLLL